MKKKPVNVTQYVWAAANNLAARLDRECDQLILDEWDRFQRRNNLTDNQIARLQKNVRARHEP